MTVPFLVLFFFFFLSTDGPAQTYRYVDPKGTICFTDNPPAFLFKEEPARGEGRSGPLALDPRRPRPKIKDILELGQEILEKELSKPHGKRNLRLVQELGESLYGDVSGRKSKEPRGSSPK